MSRKLLALIYVILLAASFGIYIYVHKAKESKKVFAISNGEVAFCFSAENYSLLEIVDEEKGRKIEFPGSPLWKIVLLDTEKAMKDGKNLVKTCF